MEGFEDGHNGLPSFVACKLNVIKIFPYINDSYDFFTALLLIPTKRIFKFF
jgi:hypothetical protein